MGGKELEKKVSMKREGRRKSSESKNNTRRGKRIANKRRYGSFEEAEMSF